MFAMQYRQFAQQVHLERVNDALERCAEAERQPWLAPRRAWFAKWRHRVVAWQSSAGGPSVLAYDAGYRGESGADD
jgi:hypothetical protein